MTGDSGSGPAWSRREAHQARRLGLVLVLTAVFVGLELAGAVLAESQVLFADGLHLLLDVLAFGLSIVAMRLAVRPPSDRFPFGLRRVEPLAAVVNGLLVLGVACAIVLEAVTDLTEAGSLHAPRPQIMLIVAAAALVVHGISAWLIHDAMHAVGHDDHDHHAHVSHGHALNLRGVWLHLVGDMLGAVTALVAAVVLRLGGPASVDPLGGLLVALILLAGAVKLLRDAVLVLLDATPTHASMPVVRALVSSEPGVLGVPELRVWTLGAGHDAADVRVIVKVFDAGLPQRIRGKLHDQLGLELVTVEVTVEAP